MLKVGHGLMLYGLQMSIARNHDPLISADLHIWVYQALCHPHQVYAATLDELPTTIDGWMEHRANSPGLLWWCVVTCSAPDRRQLST